MPTENTTLYAQWSAVPPATHTVTFNPNGNGASVSPTSRQVTHGSAIGTLPEPTRPHHTFIGWFTHQTFGERVTVLTPVTANMTVWARWNSNIQVRPARIFHDSTAALTHSPIVLTTNYLLAVNDIYNTFGIMFDISNNSISQLEINLNGGNINNGGECTFQNHLKCNGDNPLVSTCGQNQNCVSSLQGSHHRNAARLLATPGLYSNSIHTLRIVGHSLCMYDANKTTPHYTIGGGAMPINHGGRDAIVTSQWHESLLFLIQHELSHNLGADYPTCTWTPTNSERCVLRSDKDLGRWCNGCRAVINQNK